LILLVRHGETAGNASGRMQLPSEPLSAQGRVQATMLGKALVEAEMQGHFRVRWVFVSDLQRTRDTADCILQSLGTSGRDIMYASLLQERNFGNLRGQLYSDVTQQHGNPFRQGFTPPCGESWPVFRERVATAWKLLGEHAQAQANKADTAMTTPEHVTLVITHGLVLRVMSDTHLDLPEGGHSNFQNTSVTAVRLGVAARQPEGRAHVEKLNDISHLKGGMSLNDPSLQQPAKI